MWLMIETKKRKECVRKREWGKTTLFDKYLFLCWKGISDLS